MQNVQTSILPFDLNHKSTQVPEGLRLNQIVDTVLGKRIKGTKIIVSINDQIVPEENWSKVKPKKGTIIAVNVVPSGGKGKKNPLATILSLAVLVAAPYIAGAVTASFAANVSLATAKVIYGAVRIGVSLVGYLATSALTSTPQQSYAGGQSIADSQTQFIEGATNAIDPYGVVPWNLGTNRMFPKQAALPYTETVGEDQYVRQLFTYGFGRHVIQDRKIGETLLGEYDDVEMEDRLDGDLNLGTDLYANDVYQEGFSVEIENSAGYILRTTQEDVDEFDLEITFQNGLTTFNDSGNRKTRTVDFEIQYAPTGTADWSSGNEETSYSSQVLNVDSPVINSSYSYNLNDAGIVVLNYETGVARILSYNSTGNPPPVPSNSIRIASFTVAVVATNPVVWEVNSLIDERDSFIGNKISDASGFEPSYSGKQITIAAGNITPVTLRVSHSTANAFRVSHRRKFPSRGQWDVRIKRLTADEGSDRVRDIATLTSLKSITYAEPVNQEGVSGSAMRIRGTGQLNGSVDRYNAVVSTILLDYNADDDIWQEGISSNPASIYRHVLQENNAFIKAVPDERINLTKLEEWHAFCELHGLTYNRVIDYRTSVEELLSDIAAAGMATKHNVNGIHSVIIDNERPLISALVTPRNSWGYSGNINYPEIPHALRVEFRNRDKDYITDERIVYQDGYDENNAEEYERLEFQSCNNSDLAYFYGRMYIATAELQPETHVFNMDFENLTFNRGDRVVFVNDVILVGVGQGRIKELIVDDVDTPTQTYGFIIDDTVEIPNANNFAVRIRHGDASGYTYHLLQTVVGQTNEFTFTTPLDYEDSPDIGSLCAFVEDGSELDLIVTEIKPTKNENAKITCLNYAPERFDAIEGVVPPFESNITLALDLFRPLAPVLSGEIQSDETVMQRNSDGSYLTKMLIPLTNRNESSVQVYVKARITGGTQWFTPDILSSDPTMIALTGLQDDTSYDIEIRYQRATGERLTSMPLMLNSVKYIGASTEPAQVEGFKLTISDSLGLFEWLDNDEIDIKSYEIRFTRLKTGVSWVNAQTIADNIRSNRITLPVQSGTYLIKAVDIAGNKSQTASEVTSYDDGILKNQVENLIEQENFSGVKDNCVVLDDSLYLADTTQAGYYYFNQDPLDLSEVYESVLSSSLLAIGVRHNRLRDIAVLRDQPTLRVADGLMLRNYQNIRDIESLRDVEPSSWSVMLEMNHSQDNTNWTGWIEFKPGKYVFRYVRFRLVLMSTDLNVNVRVSTLEVTIDMPDRTQAEDNLICPVEGVSVNYTPKFKNNPSLNITLNDGAVDDRLEYTSKTNEGFTLKVYNDTVGGYVERTFDYNATGYGRVV